MSEDHLIYHVEGQVAWFTINREKQRNAISPQAIALFMRYLDQAEADDDIRVVCVTGSGDKAFCSGGDLGGGMEDDTDPITAYANLLKRLAGFPKPTVARVNGYCLAGGTGFMLACDIVIARDDARFGTPEVNVGLFPMMIGALIFRNVPRKRAMEMVLLGERLTAQQALDMGMLTRVVPADRLDESVAAVLETLAGKSPIGLKLGKQAFYQTADLPLEEALDRLSLGLKKVIATEDAKEGMTAFIEKRKPVFTGK
ncbi:MAG: enoyl-CoA hydratase/isomerase family protein [Deltaproteobacteria bacterium]|jgi:enoyl-CoA hydratase/carnithine racemase|nr:enoyl-CoA hydratase/isomerase family protein [Deltaproteobacteria bacterium]